MSNICIFRSVFYVAVLSICLSQVSMRLPSVLAFGFIAMLIGGCASDYSPRADLSYVQIIGVTIPPDSFEPVNAEDVMQLYNLTVGEDRLKNSAVGAGTGAAVGAAAGVGASAIAGCPLTGPLWPFCVTLFVGGGALLGGGTGAIAGATVDTQEKVKTAQLHLYEVNRVLPDIKENYLAKPVLQGRALQIARMQGNEINYEPAAWNGERYVLTDSVELVTDTNLVLKTLNISLNGKANDDPVLTLHIDMQWDLTKYNPEAPNDEAWDSMTASYKSKKRRLSEWLADGGVSLRKEVETGIDYSLNNAFTDLPRMAR